MMPVPGWRYDEERRIVQDDGGRTIARLPEGDSAADADDAQPVGALLAAAPDLRNALQALVEALTNAEPDRNLGDQLIIVEAIAKAGRALIKSDHGS